MEKKIARIRRSRRFRARAKLQDIPRLVVNRTPRHTYAQVIVYDTAGSKVLTSASTLDKEIRDTLSGTHKDKAKVIGKTIAERAIKAGVQKVAFDRSGFKYHGRVKMLADAAREAGMQF